MQKDVIVIIGPTASGKSSVGIELAKKMNGVIISADSMQIYKKLNIGTAKVTPKETQGVTHELIDIVDIDTKFSVSDYKKNCYKKIEEILASGKTPIIVGGTGLYINAIVNNMTFQDVDEKLEKEIDEKINKMKNEMSQDELFEYLKKIDFKASLNIEKNNNKRVLRAIKMYLLGTVKSDVEKNNDLWSKNESPYNFFVFMLDIPKALLYDRINERVDDMINMGLIDEVRLVYDYYKKNKSITAVQAIGYKEFFGYIEGNKTLDECINLLKQKTRNYAKRQITWFKKFKDKIVIDGTLNKRKIIENILKEYYGRKT